MKNGFETSKTNPKLLSFVSSPSFLKNNNIKSTSQLYFSKFKPAKRISFKNEIKKYELEVNDRVLSESELNELYRLYALKIISDEDLESVKIINDVKYTAKRFIFNFKYFIFKITKKIFLITLPFIIIFLLFIFIYNLKL